MQSGQGYSMRKLRFEIVPGFETTGILYEPEKTSGKAPAILNVNGHDPKGKAAEYKQKRCINFAKRGIFALSLEWPGFGELSEAENAHDFGAHLDLVGANALGLFYLAMRKGLDYLAEHPKVDPRRLGVTGLSGGGWQTIVLGALDERVTVAAEVAGFGSLQSNISRPIDTDEVEEDPTDLTDGQDYTAMSGTLTFASGETFKSFTVPILSDNLAEGDETFFVTLSNPTGGAALSSPATATLTINSDDTTNQPVTATFQQGVNGYTGTTDADISKRPYGKPGWWAER